MTILRNRPHILISSAIAASLLLWIIFTIQGVASAVDIWLNNEIFNHCLFIVPTSLYLIYLKRHEIALFELRPAWLPVLIMFLLSAMYVIGVVGKVNLIQHAATFALLPTILWAFIGHRIARIIWFPLVFMGFCIPVGEQLVPSLQSITADGAVFLLDLTGIPLFRSGLYIEIPKGRFVVAEACSGVSFFIASLVIGSLYCHLFIRNRIRQAIFLMITLLVPILANIARVYGIILIAHLSDMKYAVGADHLIYGWFFFAFVIIFLLLIGERFKDVNFNESSSKKVHFIISTHHVMPVLGMLCLQIMAFIWLSVLSHQQQTTDTTSPQFLNTTLFDDLECQQAFSWSPVLTHVTASKVMNLHWENACSVRLYQGWFSEHDEEELISAENRLYHPTDWTIDSYRQESLSLGEHSYSVTVQSITNGDGDIVHLAAWYVIDEKVFVSKTRAKLFQIKRALVGGAPAGLMVVLAWQGEQSLTDITNEYKLVIH